MHNSWYFFESVGYVHIHELFKTINLRNIVKTIFQASLLSMTFMNIEKYSKIKMIERIELNMITTVHAYERKCIILRKVRKMLSKQEVESTNWWIWWTSESNMTRKYHVISVFGKKLYWADIITPICLFRWIYPV
jgi:predicted regulator of amino acid metabolism with ACT domain